jgi:methionyl-tRNA synthetase
LAFSNGIEAWLRAVYACNQYVDEQAPWALKKTDPERMKAVLQTLFMALRDLAIAIQPVVPSKAALLLDALGVVRDEAVFGSIADDEWFARLVASGFVVEAPKPLFPRLELPDDGAEAGAG